MSVWDIIVTYRDGFAAGLLVTLKLAAITWVVGVTLGSVLGAASYLLPRAVGWPFATFVLFLSGVPFLVLLYWANYPLQVFFGVLVDPFITACALLSMINTVLVAETWRRSLSDFPGEYVLAGTVSGMTRREVVRYIQFPLLLRSVLPGLLAAQVAMLQLTLFASLISVEELFRVAQRINAAIQQPVEIYTALGGFFLLVSAPLYIVAYVLRRRFTRDISER